MTEYTPGPWEAKNATGAGWQIIVPMGPQNFVEGTTGKNVLMFETWVQFPTKEWHEQAEANACLIAAAPELLEALQLAIDSVDDWHNGDFINQARAAIAKSTQP